MHLLVNLLRFYNDVVDKLSGEYTSWQIGQKTFKRINKNKYTDKVYFNFSKTKVHERSDFVYTNTFFFILTLFYCNN